MTEYHYEDEEYIHNSVNSAVDTMRSILAGAARLAVERARNGEPVVEIVARVLVRNHIRDTVKRHLKTMARHHAENARRNNVPIEFKITTNIFTEEDFVMFEMEARHTGA